MVQEKNQDQIGTSEGITLGIYDSSTRTFYQLDVQNMTLPISIVQQLQ